MKYKILRFFRFERCDFCAKYIWKYLMRAIRTSESHKDRCGYVVHICKNCWANIKED